MRRPSFRDIGPIEVHAHDLDVQLLHRPEREVRIAAQRHGVVLHADQHVARRLSSRHGKSGSDENDRCEDPEVSTQ